MTWEVQQRSWPGKQSLWATYKQSTVVKTNSREVTEDEIRSRCAYFLQNFPFCICNLFILSIYHLPMKWSLSVYMYICIKWDPLPNALILCTRLLLCYKRCLYIWLVFKWNIHKAFESISSNKQKKSGRSLISQEMELERVEK